MAVRAPSAPRRRFFSAWPGEHAGNQHLQPADGWHRLGLKATLIKSLTGRAMPLVVRLGPRQAQSASGGLRPASASPLWAVCGVENPRHSGAMAVVFALQPIPNRGARSRGDLISVALNQRDLRKLLVVHGHSALLGGINISSVCSDGSFGKGRGRRTTGRGGAWCGCHAHPAFQDRAD